MRWDDLNIHQQAQIALRFSGAIRERDGGSLLSPQRIAHYFDLSVEGKSVDDEYSPTERYLIDKVAKSSTPPLVYTPKKKGNPVKVPPSKVSRVPLAPPRKDDLILWRIGMSGAVPVLSLLLWLQFHAMYAEAAFVAVFLMMLVLVWKL